MHSIFLKIIIFLELLSSVIGFLNFKKLRGIWKLFPFYLLIISLGEIFYIQISNFLFEGHSYKFFTYFIIPLEIIFLIFFVGTNLKNTRFKNLHLIFALIYLVVWISDLVFTDNNKFLSISYSVGVLLQLILVMVYFNRLVMAEEILHLFKNGMFYVAVGLLFFYVLSLPYFGLLNTLVEKKQFNDFFVYLPQFGNLIMYSLFCIAFWRLKPEHTYNIDFKTDLSPDLILLRREQKNEKLKTQ